MDRILRRSLHTSSTRSRCASRPTLAPAAIRQAGLRLTGHGFSRDVSTDTSVNHNLSSGEVLAVNLQRAALGLGLVLAGTAVYYGISNPTVHLDAVQPADQDKLRSRNATLHSVNTKYASHEELQLAIQELQAALDGPGATSLDPKVLRAYGSSENSYHPESPHSVVVRVEHTDDVVAVVNIARKYKVPIVPYSGATSLEGHFSGVSFPREKLVRDGPTLTWSTAVSLRQHMPGHVGDEQNTRNSWCGTLRVLASHR